MKSGKDIRKNYLIDIVFSLFIFVICLWNLGEYERIRVVDEFGYWGIAAAFSGWDWKDVMATSQYYSFGYSFILAPLFFIAKLGAAMSAIYKMAIAMNAFFMAGIYFLVKYVEKEIFTQFSEFLKCAVALMITLYIGNTAQMNVAWTEIYLCFMFWCIAAMLIKVIKKPGYGNTCLLLMLSANIFAIHMRAIGVVASVGFVLLIYIIAHFKELSKKYVLFVLVTAIALILAVAGIKVFVTSTIYCNSYAVGITDTENMMNTIDSNGLQGNMSRALGFLNLSGIIDVFMSVCGKMYYAFCASFLLGAAGVVIELVFLISYILKKIKERTTLKWHLNQYFSFFAILAFAGEILVSAVFKCMRIYSHGALETTLTETIVYGRYADFVVGGIMLLGIYGILNMKQYYREIIGAVIWFILLAMIVQHQFDIHASYIGRDIAVFRGSAAPWFSILADGRIDYFSYYAAIVSIGIFLLIVVAGLAAARKSNVFSVMLIVISAAWGIWGIFYSHDYNLSKAHKALTVDTVARIIEVTDENIPVYLITENYTSGDVDIKILQWELGSRSIQVRTINDLDTLDAEQAIIICYPYYEEIEHTLQEQAEFIYASGTLNVYVEAENLYYKELKEKAYEVSYQ